MLDLDATDLPSRGGQKDHFSHGYCGHQRELPLYGMNGEHVVQADSGFCHQVLMLWCEQNDC